MGANFSSSNHHIKEAVAVINSGKIKGVVVFTQRENRVSISIDIKSLKKNAKHGFHIHEKGNLTKSDCSKCEGHWNPKKKQHGGRDDKNSHAGDFGNITANEQNESKFHFTMIRGWKRAKA